MSLSFWLPKDQPGETFLAFFSALMNNIPKSTCYTRIISFSFAAFSISNRWATKGLSARLDNLPSLKISLL
jgi:hypothetical protein